MLVEENQLNNTFNEVKREILKAIDLLGELTAMQISMITKQSPEAASMALFRYHQQGLLSRQTLKGRTKIYELTTKGRERLAWLKQSL